MESKATPKAIDAWAQPAMAEFFERVPEVWRLLEQSRTPDFLRRGLTPEQTVKLMDEAGVGRVMLSAWHRPGKVIVSNDDVAVFCRKFPTRFIGIAAVDLHDPVGAVKELERCVKELGFKGLRVVPWLWSLPPNTRLYYPLFVKCIELGVPFLTQVGHTGPLMPSETGRPVPYIDEVALQFPQLKIVCGHIGYPWTAEMIGVAWKHPNVFIDTSAYLPRYYPPELLHYMRTYGKEKVLFGSNFPQLTWEACMKQVHELGLPGDVKEKFLWRNAEAVLGLNNSQPSQSQIPAQMHGAGKPSKHRSKL